MRMLDWKVLRRELAVARIKAGLEEDALATAIGVDVSTIYRIEKSASGKNNPSLDIIVKWVVQCGVSISAFIALVEGESEKAFARKIATEGEPGQFSVIKSAPEKPIVAVEHWSSEEPTAQPVPSPAAHGQDRPLQNEEFQAVVRTMQEATRALTRAIDYTSAIGGDQMAKPGRQAAKARAARAAKRAKPRKDRRKGPGAA